jgi:hypothetical protein
VNPPPVQIPPAAGASNSSAFAQSPVPGSPNADGGQSLLVDGAPPSPRPAPIPNAEAVIRSQIHPGAIQCYLRGLESDPAQAGKLVILIKVAPNGDVDTASTWTNSGLSEDIARCIAAVARRAKFDAPGGSGTQISVPLKFKVQGHSAVPAERQKATCGR